MLSKASGRADPVMRSGREGLILGNPPPGKERRRSKGLHPVLAAVALWQGAIVVREYGQRHETWRQARAYCQASGKPLLRVGMKWSVAEPPNGDVTIDINPAVLTVPGGMLGDERDMWMFQDGQFGVAFNEHTLEHLFTPEDVQLAVNECSRVADYAIFLTPSPFNAYGNMMPDHNLWIDHVPAGFWVWPIGEDRNNGTLVTVPGWLRSDPTIGCYERR